MDKKDMVKYGDFLNECVEIATKKELKHKQDGNEELKEYFEGRKTAFKHSLDMFKIMFDYKI